MAKYKHISQKITLIHGRTAPERGTLVGYGALINFYKLDVPVPEKLSLISPRHKRYDSKAWSVFTPRHKPKDDLGGHITFALKYEGINLLVCKALFSKVDKKEITGFVVREPTGRYSRRIWFLYEWLMNKKLPIPDLKHGNFIDLIDSKLQYPGPPLNSRRHRIRNNLPGVRNFCPLIRRTETLDRYMSQHLEQKAVKSLKKMHKDVLARASAFLLLKDSKASFAIEGEKPSPSRAQRWGKAIGMAGQKPLTREELLKLQQIVLGDTRFVQLGWRTQGGFVGAHDRKTGAPIPDHISARQEDIRPLINGMLETDHKLLNSKFDPVLAATIIAFGFVFVHPFTDGNGRLHRYLIHHVLAQMNFTQKGTIFPVSSAILQRIGEYREVLESYSNPCLDFIRWKQTQKNNIEVLNDTEDLYRYFDATRQAEFLYRCVEQTIMEIIPEEVEYLYKYDKLKAFIEKRFEMPNITIDLLIRFLNQGNGKLSKRARNKEFQELTEDEIGLLESAYLDIFMP